MYIIEVCEEYPTLQVPVPLSPIAKHTFLTDLALQSGKWSARGANMDVWGDYMEHDVLCFPVSLFFELPCHPIRSSSSA
jgi:hypothetical protein